MEKNKLKLIVAVMAILPLLAWSNLALASQVTGTLTTGLSGNNGETINGVVVAPPTANPGAGTYTSTQSVVLTSPGASSIHYTTDGSAPTCSTGTVYSISGPISVSSSQAIEAISCYPGSITSSVESFLYNINNTPVAPANSAGGGGGGGYIPPATPKAGDINTDGVVDILDFSIMMSQWGQTGCSATNSWCSGADLNKDGVVDEIDFSVLMADWGI